MSPNAVAVLPLLLATACVAIPSSPSSPASAVAPGAVPVAPTASPFDDSAGPTGDTGDAPVPPTVPIPPTPNVLLLVLDDWGVDMWGGSGSRTAPPTPTFDGLAAEGVSFSHAWSAPNCSPSRAALMSGLPPHRSGIGDVLGCPNGEGLAHDVETVAERLSAAGYATAMYGKWHLGQIRGDLDPIEAADPLFQGFDDYAGAVLPSDRCATDGLGNDHYDWERCENGRCARLTEYDTGRHFEDAAAAVASLPEPWFVYLPVTAPHAPYEDPPGAIDAGGDTGPQRRYRSMVADVDARLAVLLAGLDPTDTFVIVVGDNGSPPDVVMAPVEASRAKGTVYEAGVHVPLLVRGPGTAAGAEARQLVHLTDLLATLADLAGDPLPADHPAVDTSRSLVPALRDPAGAEGRTYLFTEGFEGIDSPAHRPERTLQAVRSDDGYKLVRTDACRGALDPEDDRDWVCATPLSWGEPTLELYRPADDEPGVDGVDLLSDGVSLEERRVVDRLVAALDADFAPQLLPTW